MYNILKYKRLRIIKLIVFILPSLVLAREWTSAEVDSMAQCAEKTVRQAYETLWDFKLQFDLADTVRDPGQTGVMGMQFSPITTTMGYPEAKLRSTRPGWAAWLVRELAGRGIWEKADVAVSMSGSFPALNIAVFAALQELNADVTCISSVGASSWGANEPGLSWPEMERLLKEEGVFKTGSSAVTLGGTGDKAAELSFYGRDLELKAVKRSLLPLIDPKNLRDAVKKRMRLYGNPTDYFCYINVGGGQASLGGGAKQRYDRGGWFFESLPEKGNPNGVMDKFLSDGIPCLNLLYIEELDVKERITIK